LNAFNFIKHIETSLDVSSITVNGIEIWPFLRNAYFFEFRNKHEFKILREKELNFTKIGILLRNIFHGFKSFFKNYDFIILSNIGENRIINGKYSNKLMKNLINELGIDRVFYIENPAGKKHHRKQCTLTKHVVSSNVFVFLSYLLSLTKLIDIKNEKILREINYSFKLDVDYLSIVKMFFSYVFILKLLNRIYKPKKIFLSQYYSLFHQAALYVFNTSGVNTIEFQHGIINDKHVAYNVFKKLNDNFFPKYLLVFGNYVKSIFTEENYFIKKDDVIPIGNMYLDYINYNYISSKETQKKFKSLKLKYYKIIAVSSQMTIEDKLINFLKNVAKLNDNILYIFIPRNTRKDYIKYKFPSNILIIKELNVYQIIRESDFHATVYSTCALEAPALGIPNIMINLDDLAHRYFSDILTNCETTKFVDSEEAFLKAIMTWSPVDREEIMWMHRDFYEQDHVKRLKQALTIV